MACDSYGVTVPLEGMRIRSVRHRGLKRFIEDDDDREIRRDLVTRVRRSLTALIAAPDMDGVQGPPGWRIHSLLATGPEHGASRHPVTGGSPSLSPAGKYAT
jgi:plasmid maintenance system killer protein